MTNDEMPDPLDITLKIVLAPDTVTMSRADFEVICLAIKDSIDFSHEEGLYFTLKNSTEALAIAEKYR